MVNEEKVTRAVREEIEKRNKKHVENLMNEMEGQPAKDIIKVLETKLVYWMNSSDFWYKEFMAQKEANE
jgi:hypothetical protein